MGRQEKPTLIYDVSQSSYASILKGMARYASLLFSPVEDLDFTHFYTFLYVQASQEEMIVNDKLTDGRTNQNSRSLRSHRFPRSARSTQNT